MKHCGFSCSINNNTHMTIDTCNNLIDFINKYNIDYVQLMGGELYLNPDYKYIIEKILNCKSIIQARIVTNGDWFINDRSFIKLFYKFKNKVFFAISLDQYHNDIGRYNNLINLVHNSNLSYNIIKEIADRDVVPIGNARINKINIRYNTGYCSAGVTDRLTINENGDISKCFFGLYKIGNINDYFYYNKNMTILSTIKNIIRNNIFCTNCQDIYNSIKFENYYSEYLALLLYQETYKNNINSREYNE